MSSPETDPMKDLFREEVITAMREEIRSSRGQEVLFFGWMDFQNRVDRVEVITRGNDESVGLPLERSYLPDVIIHNHPADSVTPSEQDIRISSHLADRGVGFVIVNSSCSDAYVVVEPVEKRERTPLDADELAAWVTEGGPFSSSLENFEEREGQKEMIAHICDAFNGDARALIEAGTGIGKSLAYLIPAVHWSLTNNEKVVISTNTINLQEQLLYKDIPDLHSVMDEDFSYILMKGRGNYICFNRLDEARQDLFSLIDEEELHQFNAIVDWLNTAEEESLSHLPFIPKPSLWEKINSQSGTCVGGRCAYFSKCPVNRIRRDAARAHVLVTNHHYLLADAQLGESSASLLPSYRRVIFDEAHNLEDSATSFFTRMVKLSSTLKLMGRIYSGARKSRGYLVFLQKKKSLSDSDTLKRLMAATVEVRSLLFDMFEKLGEFFSLHTPSSGNDRRPVIEINEEVKNNPYWTQDLLPSIGRFYRGCTQLAGDLVDLRQMLNTETDDMAGRQVDGLVMGLMEAAHTIDFFLGEGEERYVRWIEKKAEIGMVVAPVEIGDSLQDLVFHRMRSAILTSATLTVGGSFQFLKDRLSMEGTDIEVSIPSSFEYNRQMKMLIPSDVAEPGHPRCRDDISRAILGILQRTRGRAFVLFTSYKMLEVTHNMIGDALRDMGCTVFRQGSDSRRNLLDHFKADIHSVLFGTVSFWEGVDAPGRTLECVIITKLPFKVPTEPIIKARSGKILQQGGNPFLDYQVPLAVIKLRQGVGRLIRNRSDRGIIVILDPRILLKKYGSIFLDSIPTSNVFQGTLQGVLEQTEGFIGITP
jgi:ATP-dependent DNA helicase DinG